MNTPDIAYADIFKTSNPFEKRRACILVTTHACNLNCRYCYEKFKSNKEMPFELAKRILLKELEFVRNSDKFEEIEISLIGGEPLMNFTLFRQIVEWVHDLRQDVPYVVFASTNGTLLDEERKAWFRANKEFAVLGLSYDGDAEMQKTNRGTGEKAIDLDFFRETWPLQPLGMTVSKESLRHLAQGTIALQKQGHKCASSLAQGIPWDESDAAEYERQLQILADYYMEHPDISPSILLTRPLHGIGDSTILQEKYCGSGTHMIAYDVDGQEYPCHLFTPIVHGQEKAQLLKDSALCSQKEIRDERCSTCNFKAWCPTCYGFNYIYRGDVALRDMAVCKMIKVQARVSCLFQLNYYHKHLPKLNDRDMGGLQSALRVYRTLLEPAALSA